VRVAIDARPAVSPTKTGVGYYAWNLIHHLPKVDPGTTYLAWYPYVRRLRGRPLHFRDVREPNFVERWTPYPSRLWWRLGESDGLPRVEWFVRFDVFFATNYIPPPTRARRVVITVHDLAYRLFPGTVPHSTRRWLAGIDRSIRRAAHILVPSESTKRDLVDLYPVEPERVTVAHLGVDVERFRKPSPESVDRVRKTFGIDRPYFLYVGGIEPRKNLPRLVEAFTGLPEDVALVIAGASERRNPEGWNLLRPSLEALAPEVRRRVILTGYVTEEEKVALLGGSLAVVYPSLYEGFGLPVAEALACGAPVVTSNVSSLPEVVEDAALLVDPDDAEAIRDGMRRLLEDEDLRRRLAGAGPRRAASFTWEETARRTAAAFQQVGRGR
jgi:glycosyltransferase involved in cell wall biosynthesis